MKAIIIVLLSAVGITNVLSQNLVTLQGNNEEPTFYYTVQEAIDNAHDGDYIYIPGGTFDGFIINKRVYIIGAGYFIDSTTATGFTRVLGAISVLPGSDFGSISGLYGEVVVLGTNSGKVHNYTISRCNIEEIQLYSESDIEYISNNFISETIIRGGRFSDGSGTSCRLYSSILNYGNQHGLIIRNSIIYNGLYNLKHSRIVNCVLVEPYTLTKLCTYNFFINNIFFTNSFGASTGGCSPNSHYNTIHNNIFITSPAGMGTGNFIYNNSYENEPTDLFVNYLGSEYNLNNDFRLSSNSIAIGFGEDGTDAGITGGMNPWKAGGLPHNPHIQFKFIGGNTTPEGDLEIHIRVQAQDN